MQSQKSEFDESTGEERVGCNDLRSIGRYGKERQSISYRFWNICCC